VVKRLIKAHEMNNVRQKFAEGQKSETEIEGSKAGANIYGLLKSQCADYVICAGYNLDLILKNK
jgi:hypothetical protein